MSLPALDRLSLARTGEFYPLSQPELDQFTADEKTDPITLDPFQRDTNDWRTFRVRNETPRADGTYKYHYYKASALWQHYDSPTPKKDPLTNQPIWYEDWMALHDEYDPFPNAADLIPLWVYALPTREPGTVKAQPPPQPQPPPPRVYAPPSWITPGELRIRRMQALEENEPAMESPTPIWVHRQPNRPQYQPQYQLTDEDRESERLRAVRIQARERFDRLLQLDDPSSLNALRNAMRDVELAGEALQEFLDRMANDEDTSMSRLRTLRAENERWMRQDMSERMQRQVDRARERWQGNASADTLPDALRPARQNAMPLREEDAQEQARIYRETQRQLRELPPGPSLERSVLRARARGERPITMEEVRAREEEDERAEAAWPLVMAARAAQREARERGEQ
jgi:hypothetical protein